MSQRVNAASPPALCGPAERFPRRRRKRRRQLRLRPPGKRQRRRLPDTGSASGDETNLVLQSYSHMPCSAGPERSQVRDESRNRWSATSIPALFSQLAPRIPDGNSDSMAAASDATAPVRIAPRCIPRRYNQRHRRGYARLLGPFIPRFDGWNIGGPGDGGISFALIGLMAGATGIVVLTGVEELRGWR